MNFKEMDNFEFAEAKSMIVKYFLNWSSCDDLSAITNDIWKEINEIAERVVLLIEKQEKNT